jgi:tRNA-dihydrouridine synthase B
MKGCARELSVKPLAIGSHVLDGRAFLAPMSGVTDVAMRRIARRFGASLVFSEMVASDDFVRGAAEARLRAEGAGVEPHVVQIAGCDAHWMAEAARLAEASGASIVDINMGCPAKRVTGGWAGSALMRDLSLAQRLIEATVAAVAIPVTLKMRLGWDAAARNAPALARLAQEAGVRLVTVHGRTRDQFYKGRADWAAIAEVKAAVDIPVAANGDCLCAADARAMLSQSGADAIMVGRAALGRPWLVGAIAHELETGEPMREPPSRMRLASALEHLEYLLGALGAATGLRHARKHLAAYADDAVAGRAVGPALARDRSRLVTTDSAEDARRLLSACFGAGLERAAA